MSAVKNRVKYRRSLGEWADMPSGGMTWEELRRLLHPTFILAFDARHDEQRSAGRQGVASFLLWLSSHDSGGTERRVLEGFFANPLDAWHGSEPAHALAFFNAFEAWLNWLLMRRGSPKREGALKLNSLRNRARDTKAFFQKCVVAGTPGVPRTWDARSHPLEGTQGGNAGSWISVGTAAADTWPELQGLEGFDREQHASWLLRQSCTDSLKPFFRLFDFGQQLFAHPDHFGHTTEGTGIIRDALQRLRNEYRRSGTFAHSNIYRGAEKAEPDVVPRLGDPDLWLAEAGVDITSLAGNPRNRLAKALRSCLGPIDLVSRMVTYIWVCDTGWNKQPTIEMPRDPFLYQSATEVFVATNNFAASFKNRRGQDVYAYLGEADVLEGSRLATANDIWRETIKEFDPNGLEDGYAILPKAPEDELSTASIITKYKRMSDALLRELNRDDPNYSTVSERLFCHITNFNAASTSWGSSQSLTAKFDDIDVIWGRAEVGFASIRKTYLNLKREQTGSIFGTRLFAQHNRTNVLPSHYLNTLPVIAQLDENIRGYQNAVEAIILRHLDSEVVTLKLTKSSDALKHSLHIAEESGIAAVLGLGEQRDLQLGPILHFTPTEEALAELYLLHLALRREQAKPLSSARFKSRYLPLLAITKALGRELHDRGLWPRYVRAARKAAADLRAGRVALVHLGD